MPLACFQDDPAKHGVFQSQNALQSEKPDSKSGSPLPLLLNSCPSTLTVAADMALNDALPPWQAILAASQTAGRGQLGRVWVSQPGNLYCAVRLPSVSPFDGMAAAPALGGLVAGALRALGFSILVKWPNDLVLLCPPSDSARLRKVGGILVEERHGVTVAGIGLNIVHAPQDSQLRAQAALPAGHLEEGHLHAQGIQSLAALWGHLAAYLRQHVEHEDIARTWQSHLEPLLAFRGETVLVRDDAEVRGRLLGVDADGGLRLRTAGGETVLYSGSLQVPGENLE